MSSPAPDSTSKPLAPADLEIKDAQLIFNHVWKQLEADYGRVNLRFPKELILLGGAPGAGKGTNTDFIRQVRGIDAQPIVVSALLEDELVADAKQMVQPMSTESSVEAAVLLAMVKKGMAVADVDLVQWHRKSRVTRGIDGDLVHEGSSSRKTAAPWRGAAMRSVLAFGHVDFQARVGEVRNPANNHVLRIGVPAGAEVATWAAQRYTITPGLIARAGQSARAKAASRGGRGGDAAIGNTDVHEGLRSALDAKLVTLGTRIAWRQSWDDLVLGDDVVADVKEFIARVQHRRRVYDQWGFGRKVAKGLGLSALFSGPPGTGKTMCAGLIADALQLDLYQVDLSKVVSKWIGETEKNLGGLFDAAEAGHAILLFDEADSLFAKRTQVQSSNDRYANLEVNYLLQRMEAFAGITILTTNNDTAVDEAFTRRLSLKVDFPVPERDERERLWRALLPAEAALGPDIDYPALADRYEMTGGYIKNAAVRAAFLAAADGTAITTAHLVRAAKSEYQAMGKIISHL